MYCESRRGGELHSRKIHDFYTMGRDLDAYESRGEIRDVICEIVESVWAYRI
jgi:hypothetical protein